MSASAGAPAGFWHRYAAWSLDWLLLGIAVLGFNFLGDGLRDRYDPRMRGA